MAKKRTPGNAIDDTIDAAVGNLAPACELMLTQSVEIECKITSADLTDVVVSEAEENLLLEREIAQGNLRGVKREYRELETKLNDVAEGVVKKVTDANAKTACAAIAAFTGVKHYIRVSGGTVNVEKKWIHCKVNITPSKDKQESYYNTVVSKDQQVPFTDAMKKIVADLAAKAQQIAKIEETCKCNQRMLADLPRLARRAKSEVVKAQLRGELRTGADVLERLQRVAPKALPAP